MPFADAWVKSQEKTTAIGRVSNIEEGSWRTFWQARLQGAVPTCLPCQTLMALTCINFVLTVLSLYVWY